MAYNAYASAGPPPKPGDGQLGSSIGLYGPTQGHWLREAGQNGAPSRQRRARRSAVGAGGRAARSAPAGPDNAVRLAQIPATGRGRRSKRPGSACLRTLSRQVPGVQCSPAARGGERGRVLSCSSAADEHTRGMRDGPSLASPHTQTHDRESVNEFKRAQVRPAVLCARAHARTRDARVGCGWAHGR